jgi:hypothetical protein
MKPWFFILFIPAYFKSKIFVISISYLQNCDICVSLNISKVDANMKFWQIYGKLNFCDYIYLSVLRHEVAYFDCSAEILSLRLNPASRRCDPIEACAQGASLTGMKPS